MSTTLLIPGTTSGPVAALPPGAELRRAVRDTHLLLRLRWRFVRQPGSKAVIWLGLVFFIGALWVASQVGSIVRTYAEQGVSTAGGQFAVNYVMALTRGELGAIGAAAVGSVVVVALFIPFTGASMQALAAHEDLTGLRPARIHRFFDSIITTAASAIGFLQLITLTALGSLLTLDGGRAGGLLFMWSIWPALLMLSVTEGWVIELIQRRYGRRIRRTIALVLAALLGAAVALDPVHGKTLFGVGNEVAATLLAASHENTHVVVASLAVTTASVLVLFITGIAVCRAALALPATVPQARTTRRRLIPISGNGDLALLQILTAQIVRTPEVRRPMLTILVIGLPAVWFSGGTNIMSTLVVAIPLAVALAFGINMFGVLGSAMPWLASQPNLMRKLLFFTVALQIASTLALAFCAWAPATIAGRLDLHSVAAVAAATVVSTALTARSAAHKSVNRPFLIRLGSRGDMIVPPLTAINYTARFTLWSGQVGVVVLILHGLYRDLLVAGALVLVTLRFIHLFRQWADRDVQAFVVKQVSAT